MSDSVKTSTQTEIDHLVEKARASDRRRAHHNLHATLEDPIQRLYIALEPDTYVRPHRHTEPGKWESFVLLQGHLSLLTFDDKGQVETRVELTPEGHRTAEFPPGTWHTLVCRESPTVIMEIKPGPFTPTGEQDFAPWAPAENTAGVEAMRSWLQTAAPGDRLAEAV